MVGMIRDILSDAIGTIALCIILVAMFSTPLLRLPQAYETQYEVRK